MGPRCPPSSVRCPSRSAPPGWGSERARAASFQWLVDRESAEAIPPLVEAFAGDSAVPAHAHAWDAIQASIAKRPAEAVEKPLRECTRRPRSAARTHGPSRNGCLVSSMKSMAQCTAEPPRDNPSGSWPQLTRNPTRPRGRPTVCPVLTHRTLGGIIQQPVDCAKLGESSRQG